MPASRNFSTACLMPSPKASRAASACARPSGLTHASRATAWRDLADLVAKQALEPIGAGRNSAYRICWPC